MNYIKYILIAAGIIFCSCSDLSAQGTKARPGSKPANSATKAPASDETMPWQANRKLIWSDFKDKASPSETKYALTTSGISVGTNCQGGKFTYQVKAVFVPGESWTRDKTSDELLAHEQAHFDITELHARKLRLIFSMLPDGCVLNSDQISDLVHPVYEESDRMQAEYDKTTGHGLNKEAQRQWQQLIAESLAALDQMALP